MAGTFSAKAETTINQPAEKVWQALTDPALVKQYFFGVDVETDWKVGSPITYRGEWDGKPFEEKGNVLKVEENKLLETNYWTSFSGKEDKPENYQIVRYELFPADNGATKLTITQEDIEDQESADNSEKNWQQILDNMKKLLEQ